MKMVRKQVYIEQHQEKMLKKLSKQLNVSEAELIRRGIDAAIRNPHAPSRDLSAWEEIKKAALARPPKQGKGRTWKREDIYDRWERSR